MTRGQRRVHAGIWLALGPLLLVLLGLALASRAPAPVQPSPALVRERP